MIWLLAVPVWLVLAIIAAPIIGRRLRDPGDGLMDVADATKPPAGRETGPPPAQHCPPGLHVHNPWRPPATAELRWPCGCVRTVDGHTGRKLAAQPCEQAAHWAAWAKEISQ